MIFRLLLLVLIQVACTAHKSDLDVKWKPYFDMPGHEPRDTVVRAIEIFKQQGVAPSFAIDIGAGDGPDTAAMLKAGWSVLAIDGSAEGLSRIPGDPKLTTQVALFEDMRLPKAKFVNASYALPFCRKDKFVRIRTHRDRSFASIVTDCSQIS